jgi:hypothetical protein
VSGLPFEHDDDCDDGDSLARDNGKTSIVGSAEGNGSGDCFRFDRHPWTVRVQDGIPVHIAVGGFDSDNLDGAFCRDSTSIGCDPAIPAFGCIPYIGLGGCRDDRIGTYEFDLIPPTYSLAPRARLTLETRNDQGDIAAYQALFSIRERMPQPRVTSSLQIGQPSARNSDGSIVLHPNTPVAFTVNGFIGSQDSLGVQYRLRKAGIALPTFPGQLLFPLHWTHTGFTREQPTAQVPVPTEDGIYYLQFSGQKATNVGNDIYVTDTEPRHSVEIIVDTTPPRVIPPTNVTIPATEPGGVRWGRSLALRNFLAGNSVIDLLDPAPSRLSAQIKGIDVNQSGTLFPLGSTTVTLRAMDAAGNIGFSTANVMVVRGTPKLSCHLVRYGRQPKGDQFADVQLINTGSGQARHVRITSIEIMPSEGQQKSKALGISYLVHSAHLPLEIGDADIDTNTHEIRIYYRGPSGASLTTSGSAEDIAGARLGFSERTTEADSLQH